MKPETAIGHAMDMAKQAIAQGGKPSAVKLKVKFDNARKVQRIKKRATTAARLSDKWGITR